MYSRPSNTLVPSWHLVEGESLFIHSPSTLTIYCYAHSLPLGGVGRDFPFTGAFRDQAGRGHTAGEGIEK